MMYYVVKNCPMWAMKTIFDELALYHGGYINDQYISCEKRLNYPGRGLHEYPNMVLSVSSNNIQLHSCSNNWAGSPHRKCKTMSSHIELSSIITMKLSPEIYFKGTVCYTYNIDACLKAIQELKQLIRN